MEADASAPAFANLPSDSGGHNGNDNATVIAPSSVPDTTNNNNNTPATSVVPANGSWQPEATEAVNGGIISCADFYPQAAKHLPKAKTGTLELSTVNSTDATHSSTPNGQISSPTSNFSSSLPISAPVPMPSSSSITPSFSSSSYLSPSEQSSPPRPPLTIEPPIEVSSHSTSPTTATATATLLKETTNLESMVISNSSLMSNPLVEAITSSSLDLQHLSTSPSDNHQHRHHHHHHHHHHHQSKKNKKKKNKDKDKDKDRSHKESKHSKGSFSEEDNNAVDGMLLTTDPAADLTTITTFPVSSEEDTESVKLKKKKKKKSKDKDKDREGRRSEKNGHSDEGEEGGESRKEEKKKRKRKHHHSKSSDDTAVVGEGESVLQNTDASASSATFFQPSLLESAFGTSSLSAPADEGAGGASTSAPVAVSTTTTDSTIAADNNSEHAGSWIGELSGGNFHQEAPLMVNSDLPALPASTATSDMDVGDNPTLPITSTTANSIGMPSSAQEQLQQQQQQPAMNPGPKKVKKTRKRKTAAAATSSSSTLVSNSTTATTTTSLPVIPIDTTAAANAPLSIVHNDPTIATTSTTTNPPTENPLPISLLLTPPPKRVRIRRKRDPNAPPAKRGRPFGAKTHPYKLKRNQQLIKQLQQQQQQQIQQQISPSSSAAAAAAAVFLPPESLAALTGAAQALPTALVPLSATATATATTPTTPSPQKRGRKPVKVKLEEISPNQANQSIESTQSTPPRSSTRIRKNSEIKDQIKQEELSDEKSSRDGKRKRRGRKANKEASATGAAAATSKPVEAMDTVSAIIDSVATQATTDSFSPPPPPPPPLLLSPTVKQAKKKPAKAKQSGPMSFAELEAKVERVLAGNVSGTYTTTTTTATSSASLAFDDVKPVVPSSSSSSAVKLEEKSPAKKRGRKSKKEMLEKSLQEQGNKSTSASFQSPASSKQLSQTDSGPLSISSVLANNRVPLAIQRTRFIGPVVRIVKQGTDVQAVLQELGASGSGSSPPKKSKKSAEKEKKKTKSGKKGSNLGGGSTAEDEDRRAEEEGDSEFAMPFQYSICQRQTQLDGRGLVEESDSQSAGGSGGAGGSNGGGTSGTGSGGSSGGGRSLQAIHQNLMAEMGGNTSTEGWTCAFCSLPPDASSLGDLYGPYYVDLVTTPDVDYELMPPPSCRLAHAVGRKRSRILTERLRPEDDLPRQQYELWFHNECFCWTPRVLLDPAGQLLFIEEAITQAKRTICFVCRRPGATLSCFDRDCIFQALHYPCAKYIGCYFDEQRLSVFCGPHFNVYWPGCNVFERRLASTAASLEPKTPLAERLVERLRRNEETAQVLRLTGGASLAARVAASDCGPNVAPGRQVPVHFDR